MVMIILICHNQQQHIINRIGHPTHVIRNKKKKKDTEKGKKERKKTMKTLSQKDR